MSIWVLCVTLNLVDPSTPVVCETHVDHTQCTQAADAWVTRAYGWEARSHVAVSVAAACWPKKLP